MSGKHTKYGFCQRSRKWVPRDEMLAINVKVYDSDNQEDKLQIRLSPEAHSELVEQLSGLQWDNVLMTRGELQERGFLEGA